MSKRMYNIMRLTHIFEGHILFTQLSRIWYSQMCYNRDKHELYYTAVDGHCSIRLKHKTYR